MCTAARLVNTVGFLENLKNRISMFLPKSLDASIAQTKRTQFSATWIAAPDDTEATVAKFPTNGDRFAAHEIKKRQRPDMFTPKGFILQAIAAGWHHKSEEQMREIAEKVGRERIIVIHGTDDKMITYVHGQVLFEELSRGGKEEEVRMVTYEGVGHVLILERRTEIRKVIEETVERTAALR